MKTLLFILIVAMSIWNGSCYFGDTPDIFVIPYGTGRGGETAYQDSVNVGVYTGTMRITYNAKISVITKIVEESINKGISDSDIILKLTVLEETEKNKKVQLSTTIGSKLLINVEKYADAEFKEGATITIWVIATEEVLYVLQQGELTQKGPFRLIMEDIRERVKKSGIKIIKDTGLPALVKR